MLNKDFIRFGAGGDTFLSPLGMICLAVACLLVLVLPRKYMMFPLLCCSFLIPMSQQIVVAGVHLHSFRVVFMVAWVRLLCGGMRSLKLNFTAIDKSVILWGISGVVTFSILWGNFAAFVNRMGLLYDTLAVYFCFRVLVRNEADIRRTLKIFSWVCAVLAVFMIREHITGKNPFSAFGGVPEISEIRDGRIRAQGPFGQALLAGTFGGIMLPVFAGLWYRGAKYRLSAIIGMLAATAISFSAPSSTALGAYLAGVLALMMWPARKFMRVIRWGVVIALVGLNIVMKAPVWALIERVDLVGGSSSYHRFELIDLSISHFSEWWLLGVKTTWQWGYNAWDTCNMYVETGVTGGLITLIFFVAVIVYSFKRVGNALKNCDTRAREKMLWCLGAAVFANMIAFIGISYFDQTIIAWYYLLAVICAATVPSRRSAAVSLSKNQPARNLQPSLEPEYAGGLQSARLSPSASIWTQ